MGVLVAGTNRPENHRSEFFLQPPRCGPYRGDDGEEVYGEEGDALLRALDPHRVKMHVEFRREVMVHHSIDVL